MPSGLDHEMLEQDNAAEGIVLCTACLFCDASAGQQAVTGVRDEFFSADPGNFDFQRCDSCNSIWLYNRPAGDRLLNAYRNYYTHEAEPAHVIGNAGVRGWVRAAYLRSRLSTAPSRVDRLVASAIAMSGWDTAGLDKSLRFAPSPPAKILDYGCGSGQFLLQLSALGYDLHGAEYDPHLLGKLADAGIPIHDVTRLAADSWDAEFDHITLSHVLEHVPDPQPLLHRLFRWLKPGASLYLELPNADATGLEIFGRFWRGLEAPRHFALPSRAALVNAAGRAGFVVDHQHIDKAARAWLWNKSMEVVPQGERASLAQLMDSAPPETETNAELLTLVLRRPA